MTGISVTACLLAILDGAEVAAVHDNRNNRQPDHQYEIICYIHDISPLPESGKSACMQMKYAAGEIVSNRESDPVR